MNEVKIVIVPNVIKEVVHVCRPNNINVKSAEINIVQLWPGIIWTCTECCGTYLRQLKDK